MPKLQIKYVGAKTEEPTNKSFEEYNKDHPLISCSETELFEKITSRYSRARTARAVGNSEIPAQRTQGYYTNALTLYQLKSGPNQGKYLGANLFDFGKQDYESAQQKYIATEAPFNSADDYYRMVLDTDSRILVSLTHLQEEKGHGQDTIYFWRNGEKSEGKNHPVSAHHLPLGYKLKLDGNIIESVKDEEFIAPYSTQPLLIKHYKISKAGQAPYEISHIIYKDWKDDGDTKLTQDLLSLLHAIGHEESTLKSSYNNPITVNCNGGVGRTGILIALDQVYKILLPKIEKIKTLEPADQRRALEELKTRIDLDVDSVINIIRHEVMIVAAVGHKEKLRDFPKNLIDLTILQIESKTPSNWQEKLTPQKGASATRTP